MLSLTRILGMEYSYHDSDCPVGQMNALILQFGTRTPPGGGLVPSVHWRFYARQR